MQSHASIGCGASVLESAGPVVAVVARSVLRASSSAVETASRISAVAEASNFDEDYPRVSAEHACRLGQCSAEFVKVGKGLLIARQVVRYDMPLRFPALRRDRKPDACHPPSLPEPGRP
jgi:hypothetical protein